MVNENILFLELEFIMKQCKIAWVYDCISEFFKENMQFHF